MHSVDHADGIDRLKRRLEIIWLFVQIAAVFIAGIWAYNVWVAKDEAALQPRKTSITVQAIEAELLSVEDDPAPPLKGGLKDFSVTTVLKRSATHGTFNLNPKSDLVSAKGTISRDISIAFRPEVDDVESWFDRNRLVLKITATAINPRYPGSKATTEEILSSLIYTCSRKNPSLPPT